jgi:hypothetical protein
MNWKEIDDEPVTRFNCEPQIEVEARQRKVLGLNNKELAAPVGVGSRLNITTLGIESIKLLVVVHRFDSKEEANKISRADLKELTRGSKLSLQTFDV